MSNQGTIRVTNKRKGSRHIPSPSDYIVNIDRRNFILGNRHILPPKPTPEDRGMIIEAFRVDLEADKLANGPMIQEIGRIANFVRCGANVALDCWCAPLPCHGDVIKEEMERLISAP